MLLVKTKVAPSQIAGNGIFAEEFIPRGTVIWDFHEGYDLVLTTDQIEALRDSAISKGLEPILYKTIKKYAYREGDAYILCGDDARFTNHSDDPNTRNGKGHQSVAWRDIKAGEEITCDYYEFDDDASYKLGGHNTLKVS